MKSFKLILILFLILSIQVSLFGQPGNPGSGPIGGIIYLLLAGLGLGIVFLRKGNKKE